MNRFGLVALIPTVAAMAMAGPALASTRSAFKTVSGGWTQPKADCSATPSSYAAFWVGLGGGGEGSDALEQDGTQVQCGADGSARYYAWYELVPSAPVTVPLAVAPGDRMWASTTVNGDRVSLVIDNRTTGRSWSKTVTMRDAAPDTSTAGGGGSISNSAFSAQPIALEAQAAPGALSADGSAFTVTYGDSGGYSTSAGAGSGGSYPQGYGGQGWSGRSGWSGGGQGSWWSDGSPGTYVYSYTYGW